MTDPRTTPLPQWSAKRLAQVVGKAGGYTGRKGGWVYSPSGKAVAHGWDDFAKLLSQRGWIAPGTTQPIHWERIPARYKAGGEQA